MVSETDEWLAELIAELTHEMARVGVSVATIIPPSIRDDDLLETAAKQNFDVAVLLVNNISYAPYDLRSRTVQLERNGVYLVRQMTRLFGKPVIALYGWPQHDLYRSRLLRAGATAALRAPCRTDDLQQELKRCLAIW